MMPMGPYPYPYPGYGHPGYGQQPGQPGQGYYPQHPAAQTKVAPAVPGFGQVGCASRLWAVDACTHHGLLRCLQGDPQVHTVSPLNHATPRATGNGNPASLPQPQQQPQQQRTLVLPEDPAVTQARRSAASLYVCIRCASSAVGNAAHCGYWSYVAGEPTPTPMRSCPTTTTTWFVKWLPRLSPVRQLPQAVWPPPHAPAALTSPTPAVLGAASYRR